MLSKQQNEKLDQLSSMLEQMTGFSYDMIKSKYRGRNVVCVRNAIAYALRCSKLTFREIGVYLGGKDHSSVIHMINNFDLMKKGFLGDHKQNLILAEDIIIFMGGGISEDGVIITKKSRCQKMQSNGSSLYSIVGVVA